MVVVEKKVAVERLGKEERLESPRMKTVREIEYEYKIDENDPGAARRIAAFLVDYKAVCRKHGCLIVGDGVEVEVCPLRRLAEEDDPWNVEEETRLRGWKLGKKDS